MTATEQQKAKALEWLKDQWPGERTGAIETIRQCLAPVSDGGRKAALDAWDLLRDCFGKYENRQENDSDPIEALNIIRQVLTQPTMEDELAEALEHYSYMPRLMCKNRDIYKKGPAERMVYSADVAKAALAKYREGKK